MTADLSTPPLSLSVVIPARDAAEVIDGCLEALLAQDVELEFDVIVATGPSGDDTAARVDAWAVRDPRVRRIENPSGLTPAALNRAIAESSGDLVVRVDAQAEVPQGYLQRVLDTAGRTGAGNVGGIQQAVGASGWSNPIAVAMGSRFGAGLVRRSFAAVASKGRPTPCTSARSVALRSMRSGASTRPSCAIRITNSTGAFARPVTLFGSILASSSTTRHGARSGLSGANTSSTAAGNESCCSATLNHYEPVRSPLPDLCSALLSRWCL